MRKEFIKSGLYAALISIALGFVYAGTSLAVDWKLRLRNTTRYDMLLNQGEIQKIFSINAILIFMIEIFIVCLLVFLLSYFLNRKKVK